MIDLSQELVPGEVGDLLPGLVQSNSELEGYCQVREASKRVAKGKGIELSEDAQGLFPEEGQVYGRSSKKHKKDKIRKGLNAGPINPSA